MSDREKDRRTQLNCIKSSISLKVISNLMQMRLTKIITVYPNSIVKIKKK